MMNKYAVIPIEYFKREDLKCYPIIEVRDLVAVIEYTDQPDPVGEHWVIFDGEDGNVDCSNYLASLNED